MASIVEMLQQGVASQQRGLLIEAESYYNAVLNVDPNQPDALHLLGLVAHQQGHADRALELIRRAIEVAPDNSNFHASLGVALKSAGNVEDAILAYLRSLALTDSAQVRFNLGKAYKAIQKFGDAEREFRHAISLEPQYVTPWLSLGKLLADTDRLALAIETLKHGAIQCPNAAEIQLNLAVYYRRASLVGPAIKSWRRALVLAPNNLSAIGSLSLALIARGEWDEAQQLLNRAQNINPNAPQLYNGWAALHRAQGNLELAEEAGKRAIEVDPNHHASLTNLASVLSDMGKLSEAEQLALRAQQLQPHSLASMMTLASARFGMGKVEQAIENLSEVVATQHGNFEGHGTLLMCEQYVPNVTPDRLKQLHVQWYERYGANLTSGGGFSNCRDPDRPLRLGFVSGDLAAHPVGYFVVETVERIDKERFSVVAYSNSEKQDGMRDRIHRAVDEWHHIHPLSDGELADRIRDDRIDILFDLAGHTAHNRMLTFCRHAAPIQVSWAGYMGTTGILEMDYLLADQYHIPIGHDRHYVERIIRMPNGYVSYSPPDYSPDVSAAPCESSGKITFGALCNPAKVNEGVLDAWCQILNKVPDSELILGYKGWTDRANQDRVQRALKANGVSTDRIDLRGAAQHLESLSTYNLMDISLDTFPYSGGLTTCESLWMGVPVVTWPGKTFAGRHSLSHLANAGLGDLLNELVAGSRDQYVSNAVKLANNRERLVRIRRSMRATLQSAPLFDGHMFTRNFEQVCRRIWQDWPA